MNTKQSFAISAVFVAALGISTPALAQSGWEFGYQPAHVPDETLPMGFSIGIVGSLSPTWAIVGEVAAAKESEEVPGFEESFTVMDIGGGVRWMPPTTWPVQPFVQLMTGVVRRSLDIDIGGDDDDDDDLDDGPNQSAMDFMIQPGAGVAYRLTDMWSAVGAVKFTAALTEDDEFADDADGYRVFLGVRLDF